MAACSGAPVRQSLLFLQDSDDKCLDPLKPWSSRTRNSFHARPWQIGFFIRRRFWSGPCPWGVLLFRLCYQIVFGLGYYIYKPSALTKAGAHGGRDERVHACPSRGLVCLKPWKSRPNTVFLTGSDYRHPFFSWFYDLHAVLDLRPDPSWGDRH